MWQPWGNYVRQSWAEDGLAQSFLHDGPASTQDVAQDAKKRCEPRFFSFLPKNVLRWPILRFVEANLGHVEAVLGQVGAT